MVQLPQTEHDAAEVLALCKTVQYEAGRFYIEGNQRLRECVQTEADLHRLEAWGDKQRIDIEPLAVLRRALRQARMIIENPQATNDGVEPLKAGDNPMHGESALLSLVDDALMAARPMLEALERRASGLLASSEAESVDQDEGVSAETEGAQPVTSTGGDTTPVVTSPPIVWLFGWTTILGTLNASREKHEKLQREQVKRLNSEYGGPITVPVQGAQPMVDKAKLSDWWNRLAILQQDKANQLKGGKLSAESTYNYGKAGEVSPEIGGGIKKRRRNGSA